MGINKVQYGNTTLIDLTSDTVTADKLMQGYTAHDRTGALITGTASGAETYTIHLGTMPDRRDKAYVADSTDNATSTKYTVSDTSFSLPAGTQFTVYINSSSSATNYIYYNNEAVDSGQYGAYYVVTMPKYDIEVNVSGDDTSGRSMYVSTPMLTINENGYHNVENYGFVDVQAAPTYTATFITTSGEKSSNYVSYTDAFGVATKYYSVGSTFTFSAGTTATFYGNYAGACKRYLNGELISTDTTYVYTLPACDIEIQLQNFNSPYSQYAIQKITTTDGISVLTVTQNGTYTASGSIKGYSPVTVNVSGGTPTLQNKTVTPTESQQTVQADSGYDGLDTVTVNAVSSTYVGTGIARRSSSDLTASGATVTVPSGYYSAQASKAVASGSAGTPTATKGTVSNHSVSVTPSVTNTTGYITGSTKTGTAVSVSASELVSGTLSLTDNGTADCTNYASVNVNIPFVTYYTGSSTPSSSLGSNGDIYLKVVS